MMGYESARAAGAQAIGVFAAASESFSQKNINFSIDESIERFRPVVEAAKRDGVKVRGFVSVVVGCPFEGEIAPAQTAKVVKQMYDLGCDDIGLGDTIGVGNPAKVKAMIEACAAQEIGRASCRERVCQDV